MIILLSHDATNWIEVTFKEDMPRGMTISVARLLYKHLLNEGFKRV